MGCRTRFVQTVVSASDVEPVGQLPVAPDGWRTALFDGGGSSAESAGESRTAPTVGECRAPAPMHRRVSQWGAKSTAATLANR